MAKEIKITSKIAELKRNYAESLIAGTYSEQDLIDLLYHSFAHSPGYKKYEPVHALNYSSSDLIRKFVREIGKEISSEKLVQLTKDLLTIEEKLSGSGTLMRNSTLDRFFFHYTIQKYPEEKENLYEFVFPDSLVRSCYVGILGGWEAELFQEGEDYEDIDPILFEDFLRAFFESYNQDKFLFFNPPSNFVQKLDRGDIFDMEDVREHAQECPMGRVARILNELMENSPRHQIDTEDNIFLY